MFIKAVYRLMCMNNIFVFKWTKEGVLFSEVHNSVAVLQTYTLPVLCGCSDKLRLLHPVIVFSTML